MKTPPAAKTTYSWKMKPSRRMTIKLAGKDTRDDMDNPNQSCLDYTPIKIWLLFQVDVTCISLLCKGTSFVSFAYTEYVHLFIQSSCTLTRVCSSIPSLKWVGNTGSKNQNWIHMWKSPDRLRIRSPRKQSSRHCQLELQMRMQRQNNKQLW